MNRILGIMLVALLLIEGCADRKQESAAPDSADAMAADTVYRNGRIYTVDDTQTWVEAVAVSDGKFLVVGSNADVDAVTDGGTEIIDVGGRMVMPGLIDVHLPRGPVQPGPDAGAGGAQVRRCESGRPIDTRRILESRRVSG